MTFSRREEILSKDILSIKDVQELNGMTYQPAAKLIRDIKRVMRSQFQQTGKIATTDYIRFFEGQIPKDEPKPVKREPVKPKRNTVPRELPPFRFKDYQGIQQ